MPYWYSGIVAIIGTNNCHYVVILWFDNNNCFFKRVIEHILLALTAQDGEINKLSKNKKVRIRITEIIIEELEE